jgi:hypothetical protein
LSAHPSRLSISKKAVYGVRYLQYRDIEQTIIQRFQGDSQLVRMCINFFLLYRSVSTNTNAVIIGSSEHWTIATAGHQQMKKVQGKNDYTSQRLQCGGRKLEN